MYLYNLTLQKTTAICQSITGSFSAPKTYEYVISRGTILELMNVDVNTYYYLIFSGKLTTLISKECFGQIRKLLTFRLTGNKKDYIVVGSDSGRIVVLEANLEKREFVKIHQETFGKTGVRRITPGEYLAADPKGRAIMIGAIEKQKFVYLTSRDSENRMTISSPLEAHKSNTICFDITALDVGYENPMFVSLEVDYGDFENENSSVNTGDFEKLLVYYEMDLGLNHVVRKKAEIVDKSAHQLIPVPGTTDGPGGVIVCYEDYIMYKGIEDRITPLPKRNESQRGLIIINYSLYKKSGVFFFLAQSELGDIYKISLNYTGPNVHGLQVQYFDTVPTSVSLNLIPGFLFACCESGNHYLYNLQSLGSEHEVVSTYSTMDNTILFNPREMKNLLQCDEILSLGCVTDFVVNDLSNEGYMKIYALCGKSSRSSLRVIKQGLSIAEIANTSLPGKPLGIWSIKGSITDQFDKYIIVSFSNETLVLSVGESSNIIVNLVTEITNSGFDTKKPTLHVGLLEDNTMIQIFPSGIIHIKADKKKNLYQTTSNIIAATSNSKQIAVALQDKEIMYFELDEDKLMLFEKKVIDSDVLSIDIAPIPEGRTRARFMAIGCADRSVRLLSLDIEQCLSKISMQMLPATPECVSLIEMKTEEKELFLNVGLNNGVLMKTSVDMITGALSDTRTRYLGKRPVSLFKAHDNSMLLALSSKPWLGYIYMSKYYNVPLNCDSLDFASSFASEVCPNGIVAISDNNLIIFSIERLGEIFSQQIIPLRYTPRKIAINPDNNNIIVIESDHNVITKAEKDEYKRQISINTNDEEYLKLNESVIGVPQIGEGKWGSCIRMLDPIDHKLLDLIEFENNEAAFSSCVMSFTNSTDIYLIVGTAKDMKLNPRSCNSACIIVFSFKENGNKIEFLHRTPVEDVPLAFAEFQGRLLVGIGNYVRLYELGKKKLLKKCETKKLTSTVTGLNVNGQRIFVSTMNESFHILSKYILTIGYKPNENQFYLFADDALPRWLSCSTVLDYDTIAGCDKFENFFVYRIPFGSDEENEEDPIGTKYKWDVGYLNGAAYKLDLLAQFHRGEMITQIKKCSLTGGNDNAILYLTSMGTIGVFMPFETREEVDFFVHLEMYMRMEIQPLAGRDHQMFRSVYGPVKCVIDGDLCEEFSSLSYSKQKMLSSELDKTPSEISKKIEEMRYKIL